MTLILVYTLSKTILGHSFFNYILVGFGVLLGLSICVHVHGPTVLGFGGFHGFDGPVHLCVCVLGPPVLGFGSFHSFDGPVHLCACTWTNGFGFWWFSWF